MTGALLKFAAAVAIVQFGGAWAAGTTYATGFLGGVVHLTLTVAVFMAAGWLASTAIPDMPRRRAKQGTR